jgi:hypothetical protein
MHLKLAAFAAATLLVFTGCGSDSSDETTSATRVEISAPLTSADSRLSTVNTNDSTTYGWNLLDGTAEVDGAAVQVEMLGNVNYVAGSGEFFGFVTFTFGDDSTLATRMQGEAVAATDTSNASFSSTLTIIGGTGAYTDATGDGTFTGERRDILGGPVDATFVLMVEFPGG